MSYSPEMLKIDKAIDDWVKSCMEKGCNPRYVANFCYKDPEKPIKLFDYIFIYRSSLQSLLRI